MQTARRLQSTISPHHNMLHRTIFNFDRRATSSVSLNYDPFGRRIYKSSSSGTSIHAYDGDNLVEEGGWRRKFRKYHPTKYQSAKVRRVPQPLCFREGADFDVFSTDAQFASVN